MPALLAGVGASLLGSFGIGLGAAGIATGLAIAVGAVTVVGFGYTTLNALRGARLRDSGDGGASNNAQQLLVRSTTEPRKIVCGEALVSGPVAWMNTNNDGPAVNGSLYTVVALTGHEITSVQGVYLDDKFIPIAVVYTAVDG